MSYPYNLQEVIRDEFVLIGYVGVDSGQLMVVDPCYVLTDHSSDVPTYETVLAERERTNWLQASIEPFGNDNGMVLTTLYGDGVYPVYGRFVGSQIAQVLVDFEGIVEEDDTDEEIVDPYDDVTVDGFLDYERE